MQYRTLGGTGIEVSEIGFGGWAIGGGWGPQQEEDSLAALHEALDNGCTFIDTAQSYGNGRSERLVARCFRERGERVAVATKVPPMNEFWDPPPGTDIDEVFPSDYIIERCESSLRNLETDCLDLYQIHTWCPTWHDRNEWYEAMVRLREQGKIRAFGISVTDHRPNEANDEIEAGRVDTIQVIYNMLNQSAQKELFPLAEQHGVGIIARVPLASGALTGKFTEQTTFSEGDWRGEWVGREWLDTMLQQVERVKFITEGGMPMAVAALKFCLSHPAVSAVIPGMRNPEQVRVNCSASDGKRLPAQHLARLRELYTEGLIGVEGSGVQPFS